MTMPKEKTPEAPLLREGKTYEEMEKEAEKEKRGNIIWVTATVIVVVVRVLLFAGFFYFVYREGELIRKNQNPERSIGNDISIYYYLTLAANLGLETSGMIWILFSCLIIYRSRAEPPDDGIVEVGMLTSLSILYGILVVPLLLEGETSSRIIFGCYGLFSIAYYWLNSSLLHYVQERFGEKSKATKLEYFYEDLFWEPRYYEGQTYKQYLMID